MSELNTLHLINTKIPQIFDSCLHKHFLSVSRSRIFAISIVDSPMSAMQFIDGSDHSTLQFLQPFPIREDEKWQKKGPFIVDTTRVEHCEANDGISYVLGVLVLIISCKSYQIHTLFVALLLLFVSPGRRAAFAGELCISEMDVMKIDGAQNDFAPRVSSE